MTWWSRLVDWWRSLLGGDEPEDEFLASDYPSAQEKGL